MKKASSLSIYVLLVLSALLCVVQVLLNLKEQELSLSTETTWDAIFLIITIFWAYYDAERKDFERPFDFGLFIYVFWPVAFPWYLIKTRGIEGSILFLGFIALWLAPWFSGLVAYVYFT